MQNTTKPETAPAGQNSGLQQPCQNCHGYGTLKSSKTCPTCSGSGLVPYSHPAAGTILRTTQGDVRGHTCADGQGGTFGALTGVTVQTTPGARIVGNGSLQHPLTVELSGPAAVAQDLLTICAEMEDEISIFLVNHGGFHVDQRKTWRELCGRALALIAKASQPS